MNLSILEQLDTSCRDHSPRPLSPLVAAIEADMRLVDESLGGVDAGSGPAEHCVRHLLAQKGKRLRPLCTALAARCGPLGFTASARRLAVAAELVHTATLLHDDVVDNGNERRGHPTARVLYGNAASIFGGDWLLVEAMRFIRQADVPDTLDEALVVLQRMVEAESLQLATRGGVDPTVERYLQIAEGKTAVLFGWALSAGARAGGASPSVVATLGEFGRKLGLSFQVIDDVLDLVGSPEDIGKTALADVREGKLTYPIVIAIGRNPMLGQWLAEAVAASHLDSAKIERLAHAIRETGAAEEARLFAESITKDALARLATIPPSSARDALAQAAERCLRRPS